MGQRVLEFACCEAKYSDINPQDPHGGENQLPQLVLKPPYKYVASTHMQNTNIVNTIKKKLNKSVPGLVDKVVQVCNSNSAKSV